MKKINGSKVILKIHIFSTLNQTTSINKIPGLRCTLSFKKTKRVNATSILVYCKKNPPYLIMFSVVENALISLFIARDSVPLDSVFEVILDL